MSTQARLKKRLQQRPRFSLAARRTANIMQNMIGPSECRLPGSVAAGNKTLVVCGVVSAGATSARDAHCTGVGCYSIYVNTGALRPKPGSHQQSPGLRPMPIGHLGLGRLRCDNRNRSGLKPQPQAHPHPKTGSEQNRRLSKAGGGGP